MCYGYMYGCDKPKSPLNNDTTQDMLTFICNRCGIHNEAICNCCRVKNITKIEVSNE